MTLSARAIGVLVAVTLLPLAALAFLGAGQKTDPARAQAVPSQTSENVKPVASLPGTAAVSGVFSRSAPFFYVSGLDSISVLDVKDPRKPDPVGKLDNAMFQNEAMTLGERLLPGGKVQRFLLIGIDAYQGSGTNIQRGFNAIGFELMVVDVTEPATPKIIGRTAASPASFGATTSTHTVACMNAACTVAYSAGGVSLEDDEKNIFSIFDLTDLTKPKQVKVFRSPATAANPSSASPLGTLQSGHHWQVDGAGVAWHTGSGGATAFNISDPMNPQRLNGTDANGRKSPFNDFIHHSSQRPNARAFTPGQSPSVENGNVALIGEEDYLNNGDEVICDRSGTLQTWEVPSLEGEAYRAATPRGDEPDKGTFRPLDTIQAPAESGAQGMTPAGAFCSTHWFDFHQSGVVAIGNYQQGLRLVNVRDARNLKSFGFAFGGGTEVWDAYWVPERDAAGTTTERKTNLIYTVDAVRGVEVFEVSSLPPDLKVTGDPGSRGTFPAPPATVSAPSGSGTSGGSGSGSGSRRGTCAAPISGFSKGTRLTRTGLRIRGTSRGNGCRVTKVRVAIARKIGSQCKFLRANGRFGNRRSCLRTQYMTAKGTSTWTLRVKGRLPRGRYNAWSRAIDSAGNIEKKGRPRNFLRLRVGRR